MASSFSIAGHSARIACAFGDGVLVIDNPVVSMVRVEEACSPVWFSNDGGCTRERFIGRRQFEITMQMVAKNVEKVPASSFAGRDAESLSVLELLEIVNRKLEERSG